MIALNSGLVDIFVCPRMYVCMYGVVHRSPQRCSPPLCRAAVRARNEAVPSQGPTRSKKRN